MIADTDSDVIVDDVQPMVMRGEFDEFYRREVSRVAGLAFALCGSTGAAEDITQDAFFAAYRQWDRLDHPEAWIRQVVSNRAMSQFRRRASETKALLRLRSDRLMTVDIPEASDEVWAEVRRLPKRQAQVIALRYIDDATTAEIAATLQLTENTVKTHLLRAKQTLNDELKEQR